ncbi:gliding motility-associated C-terminal domain-containing protein [Winogradskyella vidalii]|uniref:gliding motility-associated C-terminal domain-containing protein n=1 Tax=Winogradskyella vidalii TaxID=2615024 RepID=UPI0015CDBC5E|nr:gliding motility-associated C-terminal domain-containing protein [Winogradskyella vidalii]
MKAKPHCFRSYPLCIAFLILSITATFTSVNAQCPTVTESTQTFCDVQSVLVGDLEAIDNGGGIVWYDTPTSTTPLSNSDGLINGEDYYADDSSGTCGTRARVDIIIYGPPIGSNFQGICIDDASQATVAYLGATGNDVQWYLSPFGGTPLNPTDILMDNTLYYADQASPDGSCRTSRLSVLVNVGYTPMPVGDSIQYFCNSEASTPTVGDLQATGDNNWYISLFSAFPLPENTPLIDGQMYYGTTVDPPCESSARLMVMAVLDVGPNAGEDGTLEICDNNLNSTVDLFSSLEGSPETGGTWSPALNSGTGVFDPLIDSVGEYTYTVNSNNTCPDESATVTVSIIPEPNPGTNETIDLCSNNAPVDLFSSLGGNPEPGGTWSPALASGTGVFDPAIDSPGIYTYTLSATAPCIDVSSEVTVSVTTFNDAGEDGTVEICDNIGTINLFDSLGGTPSPGGTWSPALASGTGVFNPLLDAAGDYTYSFSGSGTCPEVSAIVTVAVTPLPIAGSDGTLTICSNDLTPVDLFNSLGGTPETGGTWSPELSSGTGVFDPSVDTAGTYTYTLTGTPPCTDVSSDVTVIIIPEPDAGIDAVVNICDSDGNINLFDTLGGTPETGGTWTPTLASGTNIFDPLVDAVGTYTYTVPGTSPCADATATVTISITPFQSAGTDGAITLCSNDSSINLFDSLGGTPETGGTWTPTLTSGTGIFDPSVDLAGTYTYTVSNSGSCLDDSANVEVSIETAPNAGGDAAVNSCAIDGTIDLFDNLAGTPDIGGTWSPALASGTGVFDPLVDTEGTYTYTVSGTSPCVDATATITVSISTSQDAGTDGSVTVCTDEGTIDLFNSLGGSPDTGGVWTPTLASGTGIFDPLLDTADTYTYTIPGTGSCADSSANVEVTIENVADAGDDGTLDLCSLTSSSDLFNSLSGTPQAGGTWSPALASGTGVFDASIDPQGVYTYTINSAACGNSSATVTVTVIDANSAGSNGFVEFCPNDIAVVDLFTNLGGAPDTGGTWSPALSSGTGVFDPTIDSEGIYTYTVSNTATTCPDDTATVTVSFIENPDAGTDGTLTLCNATDTVDLFSGLTGTPDTGGTWTPTLSTGTGIFDPTIDPEGIYTYTLTNACGTDTSTVTVSIAAPINAGTDGTIEFCSNDSPLDLFDSLGGTPDTNGIWTPALTSGTGVFDPTIDAAGTYTYTVSSNTDTCPDVSASVVVSIIGLPNAGEDGILNLCTDEINPVDLFDQLGGSPETNGTWSPALVSGTGIFDPTVDAAGDYTYTVSSDECNLTDAATITVNIVDYPDATGLTLTDDNICINHDAIINILGANQLADGNYNIVYGLSEANISTNTIEISIVSGEASFIIPQSLIPNTGTTIVTLMQIFISGQNCYTDTQFVEPVKIYVTETPTPQIISDGTEFCINDNATINDLTSNIIDTETILWYDQAIDGNTYSGSELLLDNETYYASILSQFGCESPIRLQVTVSLIDCIGELLIPDGFSPNDDGINDVFDILFLEDLYPNFKLSIYNRYGNILYEGNINSPKWDGTGKNNDEVLPAGVYFYILEFNDGEREPKQGRVYLNR